MLRAVKKLVEPGESLSQKVITGGFWIFLARGLVQFTALINSVILARLLAPLDFGLMGIALMTLGVLQDFTNMGFREALVQRKGDLGEHLDTAWTISIIRGLVLFCVIFLLAPFIARFFENPKAGSVIRVVSLSLFFSGFNNIGVIYFLKNLDFRKQFIYDLSGTLTNVLVAIPLAYVIGSVWALVFGLLSSSVATAIASYVVHPYRPSLRFNLDRVKDLVNYGKWITVSQILLVLLGRGDSGLVGKVLGTTALGFYQLAYKFATIPVTEITQAAYKLTFPVYSQLQDNVERLRRVYLRTLRFISFISAPLTAGMFIMAPDFVRVFLGDKWTPAVSCMQVLSLYGFALSISANTGPLFQAVGRPNLVSKIVFLRLIITGFLLYPFSLWWGITGTAIAVLVSALIMDPIAFYEVIKIIKCDTMEFCKPIVVSVVSSLVMVFFVLALKRYVIRQIRIPGFFLLVIVGGLCYFAISYIIQEDIRDLIKSKPYRKEQIT